MSQNSGKRPLGRGKGKVVEKAEYKGSYRILGTVIKNNDHIGFALLDVESGQLRLFTIKQTFALLQKNKFENAVIEDGDIVNTECSMSRLFKFDMYKNVIGNQGFMILGELVKDGNLVGYRVIDETGRIRNFSQSDLIISAGRYKSGYGILNAKIVGKGNSAFVSAIKGSFKQIHLTYEQEAPVGEIHVERKNVDVKENHRKYLEKSVSFLISRLLLWGKLTITSKTAWKRAKIVLKEFVLPKYPELKECKNDSLESILTAGLIMYIDHNAIYSFRHSIFGPNHRKVSFTTTSLVSKYSGRQNGKFVSNSIKPLSDKLLSVVESKGGDLSDAYIYLTERNTLLKYEVNRVGGKVKRIRNPLLLSCLLSYRNDCVPVKRKDKVFYDLRDIDFEDVSGLEAMGYTIEKGKVGTSVTSPIYGNINLRWIFDGLNLSKVAEKYVLENMVSFGDIEIFRKIIDVFEKRDAEYSKCPGYVLWAGALLGVLAMNNRDMALFVNNHIQENYGQSVIPTDVIYILAQEDYFLQEEDLLYYRSGVKFNRYSTLYRGQSWGEMSDIPSRSYEALTLVLDYGEVPVPLSKYYAKRLLRG